MFLPKRIHHFFREQFPHQSLPLPLVVAVSGGPDSLALLHLLCQYVDPDRLVVVHVHHGWRDTADSEADFVAQTAVSWRVLHHIVHIDVPHLAQSEGYSLEEAGRKARYRALARVAEQVGATVVAVAHHGDDQAETVLMHLLRGSGLTGLRGMLPLAPLPDAPHLSVIRPLLTSSRAEIEAYCQHYQLQPRWDASNEEPIFFRNRIRHELLPLLAAYNPQIKERLQTLAMVLADEVALLNRMQEGVWLQVVVTVAEQWVQLHKERWQQLPVAWQRRLLRQAVTQLRPLLTDISFATIEQARQIALNSRTGAQATLSGQLILVVGYERLTMAVDAAQVVTELPQLVQMVPQQIPVPGQVALQNGWILEAKRLHDVATAVVAANEDVWQAFVKDMGQSLWLRPRVAGERIRPLGMGGHSTKVKDVMINRKIPARLREAWPLVATEAHLVWMVGHVVDERVRITDVDGPMIQLRCLQKG